MEITPGLIPDPRTEAEKALDYPHTEFASTAVAVVWKEKNTYITYALRNQDGSGSCVGQGSAKGLEAILGNIFSAHPIYRYRANFPGFGMWLQDAGNILKKLGTTTEALDPSQNMSEAQMNKAVSVDTPNKIPAYVFPYYKDIDQIAQAIEEHKHCVLTFESNYIEWQDVPVKQGAVAWGHCVCAVDYILYKGQKALIIEDSWGLATSIGNGGQRIITEQFLKDRCTGSMYFIKPMEPTKPHAVFLHNMSYGEMHSKDVALLQDCLKYEGVFPTGTPSTGNYLQATTSAVKKFQQKYASEILIPAGITVATGICGLFTRAKLNKLYGSS